jgi:N-acetylglutamate synthase-like GNAT family acetyltransferase
MEIQIRHAQLTDAEAIAQLINQLGYPTSVEQMKRRLESLEREKNYRTLVAVSDQLVVGVLGMSTNLFWEQDGSYVRVQVLIASESHRGQGIGKLLIQNCEAWAKEMNASAIYLNCGNRAERERAHFFYQQIGFVHKSSGYVKTLG